MATRLAGDCRGIDPRAVVLDLDDDAAAGVARRDLDRTDAWLTGGDAVVGMLDSVVHRVAHQVDDRIAERIDDRAIELGVPPDELQVDLLAELARQVADESREAHEDDVDGDHPDLHDHRLECLTGAGQVLDGLLQFGDLDAGGQRLDGGAVDHELAHRVHQRIEALGVDADRAGLMVRASGRRLGRLARLRLGRCRFGGFRLGRGLGAAACGRGSRCLGVGPRQGDRCDLDFGDIAHRDDLLGDC